MNSILLIIIVCCITLQVVAQKNYNLRGGKGVFTFSAANTAFGLLIFLITSGGKLEFTPEIIGFSLIFALAFSVGLLSMFYAIATGPLSLTSLLNQYSLIIPTLYGLVFLGEPVTPMLVAGLIVLFASIALVNMEKKGEPKKITLKWGIFVLLNFAGNGLCGTIQKIQQLTFNGKYGNEFMIIALSLVLVLFIIIALLKERDSMKWDMKHGFIWYALAGTGLGLVNFLVIVLSTRMAASVMFPVMSAGGILLSGFVSVAFYKEKLSVQQVVGVLLGTTAIILLNL